jgi:NADPH2:quinone reductase
MSVIQSKAIKMMEVGGPEVLKWVDIEVAEPGPDEVRIQHQAIGLNFIDVYFRKGVYPQPLPAGAYSQTRVMSADIVVKLPDAISFEMGAAMMLQGLTVQYLLTDSYQVKPGDTVLFHAAAGGVGLIAMQWLKLLGAIVIGTVGSEEKAALAKSYGCDHTILYKQEDFVARTRELTNGKGVNVVYDSIGKDTFMQSLDCIKPRGMMVTYGNASGPVPPIDVGILGVKGSLKLTRPTVMTYAHDRSLLEPMSAELFDKVISGKIKIEINQKYQLQDAAQAHRDLEDRKTTGSTIFLP